MVFIGTGQSTPATLVVGPENGFSGTITVTLSGLPSGVTSNPLSPFTIGTSGGTVNLAVAAGTTLGSSNLTFTAVSGSLQRQYAVSLVVTQGPPGMPNDRTTFVRTDDWPLALAYDPVHQLIFASALHLNCVGVISLATEQGEVRPSVRSTRHKPVNGWKQGTGGDTNRGGGVD